MLLRMQNGAFGRDFDLKLAYEAGKSLKIT